MTLITFNPDVAKLVRKPKLGFKATDKKMQCRNLQYSMNKRFLINYPNRVKVCDYGYHFCEQLVHVFPFYYDTGDRFFVVEAGGYIHNPQGARKRTEICKMASSEIAFIRELSYEEIVVEIENTATSIYVDVYMVRRWMWRNCTSLTHDQIVRVLRFCVARSGTMLDGTNDSEHYMLNAKKFTQEELNEFADGLGYGAIGEQFLLKRHIFPTTYIYRLMNLSNAFELQILQLLQKHNQLYRLDKLGSSYQKRAITLGFAHDTLVVSKDFSIRKEIASSTNDLSLLEILKNDPNKKVQKVASTRLSVLKGA